MLDWVCWLGVAGDNLQFLHGECQIMAEISATIRTNGPLHHARGGRREDLLIG